uniref:Uncharacterized protein n=1 Tax=Siphoviridae sp. ct2773 TaxID=2826275 RepID=A0A8S5QSJ4_9CAUD|nr:MAG TPA: hypothetical protein [Siphoviridae sp. ct2773]
MRRNHHRRQQDGLSAQPAVGHGGVRHRAVPLMP